MSVQRRSADLYDVRASDEWATIVVRDWQRPNRNGGVAWFCGEILIHSSFGSWANSWDACGRPFHEFFLGCDMHYFMGKCTSGNLKIYDGEATLKALRARVLDWRRSGRLSHDEAEHLWDGIEISASTIRDDERAMIDEMFDLAKGKGPAVNTFLSEPWELSLHKVNPQIEGFWKVIWPEFCSAIREELAEKAAA